MDGRACGTSSYWEGSYNKKPSLKYFPSHFSDNGGHTTCDKNVFPFRVRPGSIALTELAWTIIPSQSAQSRERDVCSLASCGLLTRHSWAICVEQAFESVKSGSDWSMRQCRIGHSPWEAGRETWTLRSLLAGSVGALSKQAHSDFGCARLSCSPL